MIKVRLNNLVFTLTVEELSRIDMITNPVEILEM